MFVLKVLVTLIFVFSLTIIFVYYHHFIYCKDSLFLNEINQFVYDKLIYSNISIYSIAHIIKPRSKSKYRKKGYGGHPLNYIFNYPLDNIAIISPNYSSQLIDLLIFIHCRPDEFYERYVYRKSYYNVENIRIIYITLRSSSRSINIKLKKEAIIYNDILQFNEYSSYFNLSIQTVHMIEWSLNLKYRFMLKTDIDVFINISLLKKWLNKFNISKQHYAIGKLSNAYILRNRKYSHYIPKSVIKGNMYPPYLQGVGYIIPFHTVELLCRNVEFVKPKIWIEDAFMGYMFKYNNVSLVDASQYIIRDIPSNISSLLNLQKFILIHGLNPYEIYILKKLINEGFD